MRYPATGGRPSTRIINVIIFLLSLFIISSRSMSQCQADFSGQPVSGCDPLTVTFEDKSTGANAWYWQFPGGNPPSAQGQGPYQVTYAAPGKYTVILQIQCPNAGTDQETKTDYIEVIDCSCHPEFSVNPGVGFAPLTVTYTDESIGASSWNWSFPGGSPASAQTRGPHQVTYYQPGGYDATLEIQCPAGKEFVTIEDAVDVLTPTTLYDYGDAPEDALAYPSLGVTGQFPVCLGGPAGYIRHTAVGGTFLGHHVDFETDGNAGNCYGYAPDGYNMDEECTNPESGLWRPDPYTIRGDSVVPLCDGQTGRAIGAPCEMASWGTDFNLWFDTDNIDGAYVNVLIDWNQDGRWGGSVPCVSGSAAEHVLQNYHVPGASNGTLSYFDPPPFRIGPNPGYVWLRMTITDDPVSLPWDGTGEFIDGETEDHLIRVASPAELFDFGDLPVFYGTMLANNGARHQIIPGMFLGQGVDADSDGQPTNQADGDDNDGFDDEDGVEFLTPLIAGDTARVCITASESGMIAGWMDFNQDGDFDDAGEHVINSSQVGPGINELIIHIPADAKEGKTFGRFRYAGIPLPSPGGPVIGGEVEDIIMDIEWRFEYDFGDAPEGIMAYAARWLEWSTEDIIGNFTTCGEYGVVRHGNLGLRYFGSSVDYETEGNGGCCGCGWDGDETAWDGDAGIYDGIVYTITGESGRERFVHAGGSTSYLMLTCGVGEWGRHLDIRYYVEAEEGAYVNVLVDWNQNGQWNDGGMIFHCEDASPPHLTEHIVRDLYVPMGGGILSELSPPDFRIGATPGYVWARFTISDTPVGIDGWIGHGAFADGESEDYLLYVADSFYRDYGDAPDGDVAYPSTGVTGRFPTCPSSGSNTIRHGNASGRFLCFFGGALCQPSTEPGGNRGLCRGAYNLDDDNGLDLVKPYTITGASGSETVILDSLPLYATRDAIGGTCQWAMWGSNIDISWSNQMTDDWAYINVLIDWNQDGEWGGSASCGEIEPSADEHVLQNYLVPPGCSGSGLWAHRFAAPPNFLIGPNPGYVWARFTISEVPVSLPWDGTGDFEDGETEDYLLYVSNINHLFDYGDAWLYATRSYDGGAMHLVVSGFFLGDTVDTDNDGQGEKGASGDDDDGINDDDGIKFLTPLTPGAMASYEVRASAQGILNGWIDFNRNGTWADDDDHITVDMQIGKGPDTLLFLVPYTAAPGTTYARFRFSDVPGLSFSGPVYTGGPSSNPEDLPPKGEVEDYELVIEAGDHLFDFGDAPDPGYPTLLSSLGAWHAIDPTLMLGTKVDAEANGQPTFDADGDDTNSVDDEDGVVFSSTWARGDTAHFRVTVTDTGYLNAWMDWNSNRSWGDPGEHILNDVWMNTGDRVFHIPVPETAWLDSAVMRFRLCRFAGLTWTGYAPDGEVEDYLVPFSGTPVERPVKESVVPECFTLCQNYPNPFNPRTEIRYTLPEQARVTITIHNMRGQIIRRLVDESMPAGTHSIEWNGKDDCGRIMPSGVYIYTMQSGAIRDARKLLMLK